MADVNNSIGLDATQANASLDKLTSNLNQANAAMTQFSVTASGTIETPFDQIGKSAKVAGQEGAKATKAIGEGAKQATQETKSLGLSFQDVARIVQSQIIFAAISQLKNGFFEAADAAAEFQLQVGRIQAIEPAFDNAAESIERMSVALGRSLDEVGEATYEALQNDLGNVEQTMGLLTGAAGDLALVTGGTLPEAVNALSSILKSYNRDIGDSSDITAKLFGTINAGRITLKDLESSLGTLSPLARQAGVDLEDMLDALATITLTGTKASVATTQLRNVFNKAIKPTEALTKVYRELGVTGFDELVERENGLVGALKAVTGAVDNDEQAVARLFNTIRGNLGVLNTLTDEGELFRATANRSAEAAAELQTAIDNIDATPARTAAKQAAELEVIFTQIGNDALDAKNAVVGFFLTIVEDGKQAEAAMALVGGSFVAATIAVKGFGVSLKTALPFLLAFTAGFAIGEGINELIESWTESMKGFNDELDALQSGSLGEVVETIQKINSDAVKEANDAFENTETILNRVLEAAGKTGQAIEKAFDIDATGLRGIETELLENFGDARERILDGIRDAIKRIDDEIADGTQKISDLRLTLEEFTFERGLKGMNDAQQVAERMERTTEKIKESFDAAANVGLSEESQKAAKATAEAAVAEAKRTLSAADRLGNVNLIQQAEAKVQEAITSQIAVERELNRLRKENSNATLIGQQQALEKLNAADKQAVESALESRRKLEEGIKQGLGPDQLLELDEAFRSKLKTALEGLDEFSEQEIVKNFGFDKASDVLNKNLNEGLKEIQIDWDAALVGLRDALANAPDMVVAAQINAEINEEAITRDVQRALALAAAEGGNSAEQFKASAEAIKEVNAEQKAAAATIDEKSASFKQNVFDATARLKEASQFSLIDGRNGAKLGEELAQPGITAIENIGTATERELTQFQIAINDQIQEVAQKGVGLFGELSAARKDDLIEGLKAALGAVNDQLEITRQKGIFSQEVLDETNSMLDRLNTIATEDTVLSIDDTKIKEANRQLDLTKQKANQGALAVASIGTSANGAEGNVRLLSSTTGDLSGKADAAAEAYKRMAQAAREAAQAARDAASAGAGTFNAIGGLQHFASGGSPRGNDTIPSMLSPGEFVMNSASTRKFLPELQAMNAGSAPSSPSSSGGDTNITIGDVNVTSNTQVPTQTGRDIGIALKRELRRGNLKL